MESKTLEELRCVIDESIAKALKRADDDLIEKELVKRVYDAARYFERLENAGRIYGNGHHMAQAVAKRAVELYRENKRDEEPGGDQDPA